MRNIIEICVISWSVTIPALGYGGSTWGDGDPFPYAQPQIFLAVVRATVTFDNGLYHYSYSVASSAKSNVPIIGFGVDLRIKPEMHPYWEDRSAADSKIIYAAPQVPIKERIVPNGWSGPRAIGRWSSLDSRENRIAPGQSCSGFGLIAEDPPGIRDFDVAGDDARWDAFVRSLPAERGKYYGKEFFLSFWRHLDYSGKTIAPVAVPKPFSVSSWTVHIEQLTIEARKLNWIKSDAAAQTLQPLVFQLNTEDPQQAEMAVRALTAAVFNERERGEITDEGDALIRLNADYMLRRMK